METLVSMSMVFLISVLAIGVVVSIGLPVINSASESAEIKNAQDDLKFIDTYIRSVASEGKEAVRIFKFSSPKSFESIPDEDTVQFSKDIQTGFTDYLSRTTSGNFLFITGNTVDCLEITENGTTFLVAENERLKAYFNKLSGTFNSADTIYKIRQKTNNVDVFVGNSSVIINNDPSTSSGTGYTEIASSGTKLPACIIHLSMNSTLKYDVYYKLYTGADFFVVDVRNIL